MKTNLKGRVRQEDVFAFIRGCAGKETFQIIFADPPYEKKGSGERFTEKLLKNEALPQLLTVNGLFVLEKRPDENLSKTLLWRIARQKKYGATEVLFLSAIRNPRSAIE